MYFLLSIGQLASDVARTLLGSLAAIIYNTIIWVYDLFEYIARAEILDNALVESIYNKVGLILGVFMLFKLIFSLVQSLIDPSKFSDKKNGFGQIIFRCIISIVLLGITPFLFKEAFQIQGLLIGTDTNKSDNVIYKLIVGTNNENQCESFGRLISSDLFFNFYTSDDPLCRLNSEVDINNGYATIGEDTCTGSLKEEICKGSGRGETNPFFATVSLLTDRNEAEDYIIKFDSLYSIIVGGVILWILIVYCLQISIRVFQLAYLQLIAPIPILSYISDPDGSFKKWLKQCGSTFLDLFIRLALIYFIVYLSTYILGQFENANSILNESIKDISSDTLRVFLKVFIIMGLFLFAKRLPDLLKDLFPNLGGGAAGLSFGISPKKFGEDLKNSGIAGLAAGAVTGGVVGLLGGGFKGFAGGLLKGGISGAKGEKLSKISSDRAAKNLKNRQAKRDGSTFTGRMDARLREQLGLDSRTAQIDQEITNIDENLIKPLDDRIKEIDDSQEFKQKKSNDAVISSFKAIREEAEKELTKADGAGTDVLKDAKSRIEYLKTHLGEIDYMTGHKIDGNLVRTVETHYKTMLNSEMASWVNANVSSNEVLARNMQIISNETGNAVSTFNAAEGANSSAKTDNASIASSIADKEHEKTLIEKQKKNYEEQKKKLNESKKIPQANQDAIKK